MDLKICHWISLSLMVTVIFCFAGRVSTVSNRTLQEELVSYLFTNYSSNLIPLCNPGDNVTLTLDLALRQVMNLNEREQILSTNVWVRMKWTDCRLTWDPLLYDNISSIMVYYDDVWIPDLTLYDSAAEEEMMPGKADYRASVSSSGLVSYNYPTVLTSACRVNVRYFPFDTQKCNLQFGSWSHHGFELDLEPKNPSGDLANFIKNSEWIIDEFPVEKHVLYYNCCPEPYPDITFTVIMQRRPSFYLLTMMFPCILTSAVAALTFMLPVESGEKVSLEITVLLSLAVFMLVVSDSMPPSSDNFPIIGTYFAASMVLVSLSCVLTIIILNVFYRGTNGRRVPAWAKLYIMHYLGRIVCSRHNKIGDMETERPEKVKISTMNDEYTMNTNDEPSQVYNSEEIAPTNGEHNPPSTPPKRNGFIPPFITRNTLNVPPYEPNKFLKHVDEFIDEKRKEDDINSEWRDLANILDRIFLLLYSLTTLIVTLAFLLQCIVK